MLKNAVKKTKLIYTQVFLIHLKLVSAGLGKGLIAGDAN